jgi:hypothetical protein
MEEKLQKYSNALATLAYFISEKFVNEIAAKPETENTEPYKFFYTILLKSNSALDTCSLLLINYHNRPHHADSLAIVLRSIITDCVIYRFLLQKSQSNETDLVSNISSIYYDHVAYTVKGLEGYFKDIYDWTDEKIAEEVTSIKRARPNYYDSDGNVKINPFPSSVRFILREMARTRQPGDKDDLRNLYHHYDILSKYEHPGELSFQLVHRQYGELTRHKYLDEIVDVINRSIVPTVISVAGAWPDIADKHLPEFNRLFKEVLNAY